MRKKFNWRHFLIILIGFISATLLFLKFRNEYFAVATKDILTNLLTINGVFSAVLITYLFTRITWTMGRKLEWYKESANLSIKITDFRRVLHNLTELYNIWDNDAATKNLIDSYKFKNFDYFEYTSRKWTDKTSTSAKLMDELRAHPDFSEGRSTLYLAMTSFMRNRKRRDSFQQELYNDYQFKGVYPYKLVEKWQSHGVCGTIWFWLNEIPNCINYNFSQNRRQTILDALLRIDPKYAGRPLDSNLIKQVAEDMNEYYIPELYAHLKELKTGIQGLNLIIIILISLSLAFGVLIPFIMLQLPFEECWHKVSTGAIASINVGLITYFIGRFPWLINKELKWGR